MEMIGRNLHMSQKSGIKSASKKPSGSTAQSLQNFLDIILYSSEDLQRHQEQSVRHYLSAESCASKKDPVGLSSSIRVLSGQIHTESLNWFNNHSLFSGNLSVLDFSAPQQVTVPRLLGGTVRN